MNKTYYLDGKYVGNEKPTKGKLTRTVNEEYYETEEYSKQQNKNAFNFFKKQREMREDMEAYHG